LPSSKRATSNTSISNDLPVGGKPMTAPVLTPRARLSDQTGGEYTAAAAVDLVRSNRNARLKGRPIFDRPGRTERRA
jgi:hypothetical protein